MKDEWRGGGSSAPVGVSPDEEDGLATPTTWFLRCPGGRILVRAHGVTDEFTGLTHVATLLQATPLIRTGPETPHLVVFGPPEGAVSPPKNASLRLAATRGGASIAVYAVNMSEGGQPAERERQGLQFLFTEVQRGIRQNPSAAARLGISVVIQ